MMEPQTPPRRAASIRVAALPTASHPAMVLRLAVLLVLAAVALCQAASEPDREALRAELERIQPEVRAVARAYNLIHELVRPSVVAIHTSRDASRVRLGARGWEERNEEVRVGEGSGFVIASDEDHSYLLTNAHVVLYRDHMRGYILDRSGKPQAYEHIRAELSNGQLVAATVVGVDPQSDLAVLRVAIGGLPACQWTDSDDVRVGDQVLALGYPLGIGYSATSGIISAKNRSTGVYRRVGGFESFLQTDAAINPGNSGGPLVDIQGKVIGVNANIVSGTGNYIGLSFAIPSNLAQRVARDLMDDGEIDRPIIGVRFGRIEPGEIARLGITNPQAVRIAEVLPGSPALDAGLTSDDVVLAIDQQDIAGWQEFRSRIAAARIGDPLHLHIWRDGEELDVTVTPIERDAFEQRYRAATDGGGPLSIAQPVEHFGILLAHDEESGVPIVEVMPDSLAELGGIVVGDRIIEAEDLGAITAPDDLAPLSNSESAMLRVRKNDGRELWISLKN